MTQLLHLPLIAVFTACASLSCPAAAVDNTRIEVREFIDEMCRDYEFDRESLTHLLAQAETRQTILDAISRPAERVVPWHEYREQFLTDKRIQAGRRLPRGPCEPSGGD